MLLRLNTVVPKPVAINGSIASAVAIRIVVGRCPFLRGRLARGASTGLAAGSPVSLGGGLAGRGVRDGSSHAGPAHPLAPTPPPRRRC